MSILNERTLLPGLTITKNGATAELFDLAGQFGTTGLIIHGSSFAKSGGLAKLQAGQPKDWTVGYWQYPGGEPTLRQLEELLDFAQNQGPLQWVAAVGGGSVLDIAKSATGLIGAPLPVGDYHDAKATFASGVPFLAVPTTAGTGSEATPAAVFTNEQTHVKKPIIHAAHMARVVILDPELLASCPSGLIAAAGMDALTQAIESFTSLVTTPFTDAIASLALERIARSLPEMVRGFDAAQAEDLLIGSYLAGVALSNARLGLVHGLAHPLGSRTHAPHGLVCAICLPHVLRFNRQAIGEKYETISRILGRDAIEQIDDWIADFGLQSPFTSDLMDDRDAITRETLAGATTMNPRRVTEDDVHKMLATLIGS